MTPQRPPRSPRTMDSLNIDYEDLKREIKADAEYWYRVATPYQSDHDDDTLDYEDMLYDDYSNETDVECY
mgnify:CR=1 FL=1